MSVPGFVIAAAAKVKDPETATFTVGEASAVALFKTEKANLYSTSALTRVTTCSVKVPAAAHAPLLPVPP